MKKTPLPYLLLGTLLFISGIARGELASPILEFRFDEGTQSEPSTGTDGSALEFRSGDRKETDLHGPDASGVSGKPGDRAFDNSASPSMGEGDPGGLALLKNPPLAGLKSFTVTGWFRTKGDNDIENKARLCEATTGNEGIMLYAGTDPGTLVLQVNRSTASSPSGAYAGHDTWIFFAVSFDGTSDSGNAAFYIGSPKDPVTSLSVATMKSGAVEPCPSPMFLGNSGGFERTFRGLLDDVRLFGSQENASGALTEAEIETVRKRALQRQ